MRLNNLIWAAMTIAQSVTAAKSIRFYPDDCGPSTFYDILDQETSPKSWDCEQLVQYFKTVNKRWTVPPCDQGNNKTCPGSCWETLGDHNTCGFQVRNRLDPWHAAVGARDIQELIKHSLDNYAGVVNVEVQGDMRCFQANLEPIGKLKWPVDIDWRIANLRLNRNECGEIVKKSQ